MSDDDTDDTLENLLGDADEHIDDDLADGELTDEDIDGELFEDADDVLDDTEQSEDDKEEAASTVPLDVSEDGDDEIDGEPPVDLTAIDGIDVDDPVELAAEDHDTDDTIREGEFVCSSCHMAKRSSALADPDEMLCRDCV